MISFPTKGTAAESLLVTMRELREHDVQWRAGKTWGLIYDPGSEVTELLKEAYTLFFSENGLNPMAFPSLRKFIAWAGEKKFLFAMTTLWGTKHAPKLS